MFEFRQLRQYVVVAEELNFRRAAQRLHMSQPPLSVAMQNLESTLGTRLLDRSRHHVRLTPAGVAFHKDALRLLQLAAMAADRARRTGLGQEGTLRLSFVPSAALDLLPGVFKRFRRDYPTVHLQLTAETTTRQLEGLRSGEIDLALVVGPVFDASGLQLVRLKAQPFALAVPASHALAGRERVRLRELAAESFVGFPSAEGAGFAAAVLSVCQEAGFLPRVVQEASQMQAILTLVAGGLGVALVPASMGRLHMEDVVLLDIADRRPPRTYELVLAYAPGNDNPVIQAFVSIALRTARR